MVSVIYLHYFDNFSLISRRWTWEDEFVASSEYFGVITSSQWLSKKSKLSKTISNNPADIQYQNFERERAEDG